MLAHGRHVGGIAAPAEDAAVDAWMQRLHAAVEHFRKARVVRYLDDPHALAREQCRGAAGGKDFDTQRLQFARELDDAALIGDADEGARNGH